MVTFHQNFIKFLYVFIIFSEISLGFDSFQKAKDNLKAFQACLEHLHGHAERVPFRRWKAKSKCLGCRRAPKSS